MLATPAGSPSFPTNVCQKIQSACESHQCADDEDVATGVRDESLIGRGGPKAHALSRCTVCLLVVLGYVLVRDSWTAVSRIGLQAVQKIEKYM